MSNQAQNLNVKLKIPVCDGQANAKKGLDGECRAFLEAITRFGIEAFGFPLAFELGNMTF